MAIPRTPIIDDDGTGTTGTVIDNAWKTELYNQIDGVNGGVWVDVAYNPADFTAGSGGTWTPTAPNTAAYRIVGGDTLIYVVYGANFSIAGAPAILNIKLPGGRTAVRNFGQPYTYYHTGGTGTGWSLSSGTTLQLYRDILGTPWAAGTHHFSGVFLINV